jgi:nucleoside recognition membrane protein YjiH
MKKKNWLLVIIIIIAVLLIATVIWIYSKRIGEIENKMKSSPASIRGKLVLRIRGDKNVTMFSATLGNTVFLKQQNKLCTRFLSI